MICRLILVIAAGSLDNLAWSINLSMLAGLTIYRNSPELERHKNQAWKEHLMKGDTCSCSSAFFNFAACSDQIICRNIERVYIHLNTNCSQIALNCDPAIFHWVSCIKTLKLNPLGYPASASSFSPLQIILAGWAGRIIGGMITGNNLIHRFI